MEKIGFKEAAELIGCTKGSLRVKYREWGVPYYKIGAMVRFSPREIYGWLEMQAHNQPVNEE